MAISLGMLDCVAVLSCGGHLGQDSGGSGAPHDGSAVDPLGAEGTGASSSSSPTTGGSSGGGAPGPGGSTSPGRGLYTTCSMLGALDCSLSDPKIRLLCDGMTWKPIGVCTGQQVCDTHPGPNQGLCTGPDAADSGANVHVGDASDAGVALYAPCATLGALQCSFKDPKIQLLCDGMNWSPIGVCTAPQVCDPWPGPNQGLCENP